MKILAILLNVFICPVGTFVAGQITSGIIQLVLIIIAGVLLITGIGAIVGIPLMIIIWVWGLIIAVQYKPKDDGIQRFG